MSSDAPDAPSAASDERVSLLTGDRLCAGCGFNLAGQPVVRERHYRMLIVRCPECSQVAALLEYPLLGRWANRWAALLAALWLLVLVAIMVATAGVFTGFGQATVSLAARGYAGAIAREHAAWLSTTDDATRAKYQQWQGVTAETGPYAMIAADWWQQQDEQALFRRTGGWAAHFRLGALAIWVWVAVAGLIAGAVMAVAMTGARRSRLALVALAPVGLAAAFSLPMYLGEPTNWAWAGGMYAMHLAEQRVGPVVAFATIGFALPCLCAGMAIGRPTVRAMIRVLLPPRLRGPLATLWIADGLPPPPVR